MEHGADDAALLRALDEARRGHGTSIAVARSIPMNQPFVGPLRRDGATDPNMSGPLGTTLAQRLADPSTGIVLNSWIDADRALKGGASAIVNQ